MFVFSLEAQELNPELKSDNTTDFPNPGEGASIYKLPTADGETEKVRKKYFYMGELTWRGGILLTHEAAPWSKSRKESIEQDLLRQESQSNSATNVNVPDAANFTMNYLVGLEGLLGVSLDQLPVLEKIKALHGKRFLRVGFHAYMAPYYKKTTQTVSGPFSYYDAMALTPTRTYAGKISVDENLLHVSPGLSFFYWYEEGFFNRAILPYLGVEVGFSILYGKRKYTLQASPFNTVVNDGYNPSYNATYTVEANLQESIINDFGFRVMPAAGFQWHITSGSYIDVRIGFQIQEYSATLNRRGSLTEMQKDNTGAFKVTWSEDFLKKTESTRLSQSGIVILLGYTAGLF